MRCETWARADWGSQRRARLAVTRSITAVANQSATVLTGGRIPMGESTAALPAGSVFTVNTSGGGFLTLADQSYVDFDLF